MNANQIRSAVSLIPTVAMTIAFTGINPVSANEVSGGIEEVVVTARKKSESIQDVPLSISAFTEDAIESSSIFNVGDIALMTPNLSHQKSLGRYFDRPTMRGMSNILGVANVGQFVDGVFVQGSVMTQDMMSLERVEVIKGPQAALYGRSTFAGAINFITRDPSEEFEGRISATAGNYNRRDLSFYTSGPLTDTWSFVAVGSYYDRGDMFDNVDGSGARITGGAGSQNTVGGMIKLRWEPSDTLQADLKLSYSEDDDNSSANTLLRANAASCAGENLAGVYYCGEVPAPSSDVSLSLASFPDGFVGISREKQLSQLRVVYEWGDYTITSNTAYSEENFSRVTDGDYTSDTALGGFTNQKRPSRFDDFQQEVRINSDAAKSIRWAAGVYYYNAKFQEPEGGRNYFISGAVVRPKTKRSNTENTAIFASVEYDFSDQLTGSVEGRFARDELESEASEFLQETYDSFTPRFILDYEYIEGRSVYANLAKGNKPGGFNTDAVNKPMSDAERNRLSSDISYDEEEAWTYELGSKNVLLDDTLRLNMAIFYIDWDQQQLTTQQPYLALQPDGSELPDQIGLIRNVGATKIYGVEIDSRWQINQSWALEANYGYTHARLETFDDAVNETITGSADIGGNELPNVPEHTFSASAIYDTVLTDQLNLNIRTDYTFESSRYAQVHNLAETGDMTRLNLRATLAADSWDLALWVKNITDDDSVSVITRFFDPVNFNFQSGSAFVLQASDPRTYGVTATYKF
jgi:outer membrane receptor protein involved in Fe transport